MSAKSEALLFAWAGWITCALLGGILFGIADVSESQVMLWAAYAMGGVGSLFLAVAVIATGVKFGIQAARS